MKDDADRLASPRDLLSAIVPVVARHDDPHATYAAYRDALARTGRPFEVIYVLDGPMPAFHERLLALQRQGEPVSIVTLSQRFGEAVCLGVGVQRARGDRIVMLPPYLQIEPAAIPEVVAALDRVDVVAACRDRSADHWLNRVRHAALRGVSRASGTPLEDLGCLVRAFRRPVLDHVVLQDEHHRFLPVLAQQAGFVVEQVKLPQAASDRRFRMHAPSVYLGRALDLLAVAFLLRFVQRPFRFFGTVGAVMAALGTLLAIVLVAQKLVLAMPLGDRPALLLAALLVVLGIQIAAVGLIAEIIIFTRAGRNATYEIDRIVEAEPAVTADTVGRSEARADGPPRAT